MCEREAWRYWLQKKDCSQRRPGWAGSLPPPSGWWAPLGPVTRLGGKLSASGGSAKRRGPDEEETVMNSFNPFWGRNLKRPSFQQLVRENLRGGGFARYLVQGSSCSGPWKAGCRPSEMNVFCEKTSIFWSNPSHPALVLRVKIVIWLMLDHEDERGKNFVSKQAYWCFLKYKTKDVYEYM